MTWYKQNTYYLYTTPGYRIVVGWDCLRLRLFGCVYKEGGENKAPIFEVGTRPLEWAMLEELTERLLPWGGIPEDVSNRLSADVASSPKPNVEHLRLLHAVMFEIGLLQEDEDLEA